MADNLGTNLIFLTVECNGTLFGHIENEKYFWYFGLDGKCDYAPFSEFLGIVKYYQIENVF